MKYLNRERMKWGRRGRRIRFLDERRRKEVGRVPEDSLSPYPVLRLPQDIESLRLSNLAPQEFV